MKNIVFEKMRCRIADLRGRGIYSEYADQYRCIFIHIPKAAGSSVAKALFGKSSRHLSYIDYEAANPKKFERYFKFAFVRNPWDRLVSAYVFLKNGGMNSQDRNWADLNLASYNDFDSFVKGWVNKNNIMTWVHFIPQFNFICDAEMNIKMDFVGRFETIDSDFSFIQGKIGLPLNELPKVNASRKKESYTSYYTEESRQIVADVYKEDIRLFNYYFGK